MSRKVWITVGVIATAVGVTAIAAKAYRAGHGGQWHDRGDAGGGESRMDAFGDHDRRGWRDRWRREISKEDFDAKTRSRFAKWDKNSDGKVDTTEVEAGLARRMESRWHRKKRQHGGRFQKHVIQRFDTDRDGKVTNAEVEARVKEGFARIDLDGDGRITDADLPPIMRGKNILSGDTQVGDRWRHRGWRMGRSHHGKGRMLRHVIGADADKDGEITLAELQAHAAKRLARFDRNKDGIIDASDHAALRKEMMDYRVRRILHHFGASQTGTLTLEQFTEHRNKRFARKDLDGNGTLSRHEMRGGRSWGGHHRWGRHHDRDEETRERRQPDSERKNSDDQQ